MCYTSDAMQIELTHLKKTYKSISSDEIVEAVHDVSLHIPSNTIFGIIGKSGAGKSSLVRLVSLLERPDQGEVLYDGIRVDTLTGKELIERRRKSGMIFQNFNLFSSRTAAQNIAYPLEICGAPKSRIKERVAELLDLVGLADRAAAPVSTLSGGQKQRIAIARALANNPDILFCDEATSALDPQTTQSILNLIREIQKKMNLTVVMITHQMEVVRDACAQVAVLDNGRVVETGNVEDIFIHPKTEVTKDFLSHLNQNESEKGKEAGQFVRWSNGGGKYTLHFQDTLTDSPVISEIAKRFDISFNIRAAGIQSVQEKKIGTLVMDFDGEAAELAKVMAYLHENGVIVEEEHA